MNRLVNMAALSLGLLLLVAHPSAAATPAAIGQPAPALVVKTLDGTLFDLHALKGKVIVVNFWATWCPPCREEMPSLDAFYRTHHMDGLELIGLSVDLARNREKVQRFMKFFRYPAALTSDATVNEFGLPRLLPVTYVIDAQGVVRAILVGAEDKPISQQQLEAALLPLLAH
jgi:cytochrome c biogenesis protein CcmG, thiol:disulfide interchange protein DsbE